MSVWTHLAGIVRFDTLRHGAVTIEKAAEFVRRDVPQGSELPVEFACHENPMRTALAAYVISFHGDLRGFGSGPNDIPALVQWMERIANGASALFLSIRQMVVTAEVEFVGTHTWVAVTDGDVTARVRFVRTFEPYRSEPVPSNG